MIRIIIFIILNISLNTAISDNKREPLAPFGIAINEPYLGLKYSNAKHSEAIVVYPKEPMLDFFQTYQVVLTPNDTVFSVNAFGEYDSNSFTCLEIISFFEKELEKKYNYYKFEKYVSKDTLVFQNDVYTMSVFCMGKSINYLLKNEKPFPDIPVEEMSKFNKFKSTL